MPTLIGLKYDLARALELSAQRQAERRARWLAVRRFSCLHPYWYELRFDEAFLARLPEGLLESRGAEALAREWTRQFSYRDQRHREREVRQLVPVAECFLSLLEEAESEAGVRAPAVPIGPATEGLAAPPWVEAL